MKGREGRQQRHHGEAISNLNDETPLCWLAHCAIQLLSKLHSFLIRLPWLLQIQVILLFIMAELIAVPTQNIMGLESSVACLQQSAFASQQNS